MAQNRWRTGHNVSFSDEELKLIKEEATRANPPRPFTTWIRETIMAGIYARRNRVKK